MHMLTNKLPLRNVIPIVFVVRLESRKMLLKRRQEKLELATAVHM